MRAVSTKQRSLGQNKKYALSALKEKLEALHDAAVAKVASDRRASQPKASFGSPYVRTYRLVPPVGILDHVTETTHGLEVMDGKLDEIIKRRLKS